MKALNAMITCFLVMACTQATGALPDSLGLKEEDGKTYIMHRIDRGETLYSLSKRYDVTVDQLKATNPQTADQLVVGEVIQIPYKADGSNNESATEGQSWKRHTVKKGETLFSISQQYDAEVKQIKKWNNLKGNNIAVGQKLKVGKKSGGNEKGNTRNKPKQTEQAKAQQDIAKKEKAQDKAQQDKAEASKTENNQKDTGKYAKAYNEKAAKTTTTPKGNGLVTKTQEGKATWLQNSNISTQKSLALHRSAPAGTIIKVKNLMNDETVYVRTVGQLNKQRDKNTLITISKKAAKELGVSDDYFRAELRYTVKQPSN